MRPNEALLKAMSRSHRNYGSCAVDVAFMYDFPSIRRAAVAAPLLIMREIEGNFEPLVAYLSRSP